MLFKRTILLLVCLLAGGVLYAQDNKQGWQVELKKLAFDFTSTEVHNAEDYQDFSNARLSSDSQTAMRGRFDGVVEYHSRYYLWTNELLMDYGRTRIRPVEGETLTNENADNILFTTGYTQRLWKIEHLLGGFEIGPFFNLGYETEFTQPDNSPRKKILRGTGGVKLFEGTYVKNLFAAVVGERDYTYHPAATKLAWETGIKLEHPVRDGVKAQYSALFRQYLSSSDDRSTDLDYEFAADARLDVELFKNLCIAPFISYYTAQAKYFGPRGENIYVGVSLSFSHIFKAAKEIQ